MARPVSDLPGWEKGAPWPCSLRRGASLSRAEAAHPLECPGSLGSRADLLLRQWCRYWRCCWCLCHPCSLSQLVQQPLWRPLCLQVSHLPLALPLTMCASPLCSYPLCPYPSCTHSLFWRSPLGLPPSRGCAPLRYSSRATGTPLPHHPPHPGCPWPTTAGTTRVHPRCRSRSHHPPWPWSWQRWCSCWLQGLRAVPRGAAPSWLWLCSPSCWSSRVPWPE